jgi:alpha-1,2-mannosyltransferase
MTDTSAGVDLGVDVDAAPEPGPAAAPGPGWWANPRIAIVAAVAAGLLALGMCVHQLSLPGVLHGIDEYDDGFYLGTVMRLVHGTLPYKDFVYPQPPGLPLLLFPMGILGRIVGTRSLMADVRILTALVAATNAGLAAFLLRRRGIVPALVAGVLLALYPLAVTADKTLMLEPYLVLFCLIGACIMFKGDDIASGRRLVFAGLALGFACTLKLWAVLPIAVAIACCLPQWRRQVRPLAIGIVVGAAVPALPFFLLAPSDFVHDLVGIQFLRHQAPDPTSVADRLMYVTGISGLPGVHATHGLAVTIALVFAALVVIGFAVPIRRTKLDWFALGTAILAVAAMFISPDFHFHYTYFAAAFVPLLVAVSVDRVARFVGSKLARGQRPQSMIRSLAAAAAIVVIVVSSVWAIGQETHFDRIDPGIITVGDVSPLVAAHIPKGACTVTDEAALTIIINRFVPDRSGCPAVVDTFSTWISYDPNVLPPSSGPYAPSLVGAWQSWLGAADYAVFSQPYPFRIPWPPELVAWFNQHYHLVWQSYDAYVYEFVGTRGS